MNIEKLTEMSPLIGKGFADFMEEHGLDESACTFQVMPPYQDEELGWVAPVTLSHGGKMAALRLAEEASPEQFKALADYSVALYKG